MTNIERKAELDRAIDIVSNIMGDAPADRVLEYLETAKDGLEAAADWLMCGVSLRGTGKIGQFGYATIPGAPLHTRLPVLVFPTPHSDKRVLFSMVVGYPSTSYIQDTRRDCGCGDSLLSVPVLADLLLGSFPLTELG